MGICHVLRMSTSHHQARLSLAAIWLFAFTVMTPWALYYQMTSYRDFDFCSLAFPHFWQQKAFFLGVIFLMCYALPLAFIIVCYSMIGYRVWHRDAPGITSSVGVIEKSKIRVVKMLVVVVLLFAVSWLPMYVINIVRLFVDETQLQTDLLLSVIIPFAQWLGTSNCCMNPMVYCFFSQKIRKRIRAMLCCSEHEDFGPNRSVYSNVPTHRTTVLRENTTYTRCVEKSVVLSTGSSNKTDSLKDQDQAYSISHHNTSGHQNNDCPTSTNDQQTHQPQGRSNSRLKVPQGGGYGRHYGGGSLSHRRLHSTHV